MSSGPSEDLVWAVKNGDMEVLRKSVQSKVDFNTELQHGRNALHFAADYGQTEVLKYLLSNGAKSCIDTPDKHGITPLLAAIYENHFESVKVLLKEGARKDGKAPDGSSYYDCAETDEIKNLLK